MHGTKEDDVPVPPLFKTALVWGLFMGVSSNTRYQVRCPAVPSCPDRSRFLEGKQLAVRERISRVCGVGRRCSAGSADSMRAVREWSHALAATSAKLQAVSG